MTTVRAVGTGSSGDTTEIWGYGGQAKRLINDPSDKAD
jgi:hypothetical protein